MVKILRLASYFLAGAAVVALVGLVMVGTRGDADIEAFLGEDGVIERLKSQAQTATQKEDAVSPLVNQARAFALRIDPPPPPPTRREPPPPDTARQQARPETPRPTAPTPTPPQTTARYELLATAHYPNHPEQSLALLKPVTGSAKWHRQGERIGHLNIHEIREGSVVLYQGDVLNTELFVPSPVPRHKPLLKADAEAAGAADRPSSVAAAVSPAVQPPAQPTASPTETAVAEPEGPTFPTGMSRAMQTRRQAPQHTPSAAAAQRAAAIRSPSPAHTPTAAEQKESIEQSISSIQEIMTMTSAHSSPEEQQKEQEMWMKLLEILQHDKQAIDTPPSGQNGAAPNRGGN